MKSSATAVCVSSGLFTSISANTEKYRFLWLLYACERFFLECFWPVCKGKVSRHCASCELVSILPNGVPKKSIKYKNKKIGCYLSMLIKINVLRTDLYCCDFSIQYRPSLSLLVLTIIFMCVLHARSESVSENTLTP